MNKEKEESKYVIQHGSFSKLYNKDQDIFNRVFGGQINTISTLSNRMIKMSKEFYRFGYEDENKMVGDLFEIFTECFLKILSADNRIGVYDYKPVPSNEDYGVDGTGIGMDGKPLTVQSKFRTDVTRELLSEDLNQFGMQSIVNYGVDKDTRTNMILFTNVIGMHWATESIVFSDRIRTIGYNDIKLLINNNTVFWKNLQDIIIETIRFRYNINIT